MTESDLKEELGLTKFGLRRKISLRLTYLRSLPQGDSAADQATPQAPPALAATTPGSSEAAAAVPAAPAASADAQTLQPAEAPRQQPPGPSPSAPQAEGEGGANSPAAAAESPVGGNGSPSPADGMQPLPQAPAVSASPEASETQEQNKQHEQQQHGEEDEEVEVVEAAGLSAGELASAEMAEQAVIDAQLDAEALCVTTCRWVLQQMRSKLTCRERRNWGPAPVVQSRLEELKTLEAKGGPPGAAVLYPLALCPPSPPLLPPLLPFNPPASLPHQPLPKGMCSFFFSYLSCLVSSCPSRSLPSKALNLTLLP